MKKKILSAICLFYLGAVAVNAAPLTYTFTGDQILNAIQGAGTFQPECGANADEGCAYFGIYLDSVSTAGVNSSTVGSTTAATWTNDTVWWFADSALAQIRFLTRAASLTGPFTLEIAPYNGASYGLDGTGIVSTLSQFQLTLDVDPLQVNALTPVTFNFTGYAKVLDGTGAQVGTKDVNGAFSITTSSVPEPSAFGLAGVGIGLLVARRRRWM